MTPPGRIDVGPPIVIAGAVLLLVSLFLDWYEPGVSAWTVFEVLDLVLAALAFGCLLGAAVRLGLELPGGRVLWDRFAILGVLAFVLVLSQVINHPPAAVGEDPKTGIWLALGGAALLALGGLLSVTRISFALELEGREARTSPDSEGSAGPVAGAPPRPSGVKPGGRLLGHDEAETAPLDSPPHDREQR